ncbi:MAG: hypothetical protein CL627_17300 [Aurantimonas sp.]|nr:hypothetical protein [Aurantimonas sp.]
MGPRVKPEDDDLVRELGASAHWTARAGRCRSAAMATTTVAGDDDDSEAGSRKPTLNRMRHSLAASAIAGTKRDLHRSRSDHRGE